LPLRRLRRAANTMSRGMVLALGAALLALSGWFALRGAAQRQGNELLVARTASVTRAPDVPARAEAMNRPSPTVAPESNSLRARVERLLGRTSAQERFQAFDVLAACAHAIEFDRYLTALPPDRESKQLRQRYGDGAQRIAQACGDLSAQQVSQRLELAERAADEGVPGAASAWVEEGPYGDRSALTQRADDPLVAQWVQQAIARVNAATKRADTEAIGQFGMLCLHWDLDDVTRVRLLIDDALERRHEHQIARVRGDTLR